MTIDLRNEFKENGLAVTKLYGGHWKLRLEEVLRYYKEYMNNNDVTYVVLQIGGMYFTRHTLPVLCEFVHDLRIDGKTVVVEDPGRELLVKAIDGYHRNILVYQDIQDAVVLKILPADGILLDMQREIDRHPYGTIFRIVANYPESRNKELIASFYILISCSFNETLLAYDSSMGSGLYNMFFNYYYSTKENRYAIKNSLPYNGTVHVMNSVGVLIELNVVNGLVDTGIHGILNVRDLPGLFMVIPPDFGNEYIDINAALEDESHRYHKLLSKCVEKINSYISSRADVQRDLYTILN